MCPDDNISSLSEEEIAVVEQLSLEHREGLNIDKVERIVQSGMQDLKNRVGDSSYSEWSPEERAAYGVLMNKLSLDNSIDAAYIINTEAVLRSGIDIIQKFGDIWRFRPCVEIILEQDYATLENIFEFFMDFHGSDYDIATQQYRNSIHDGFAKIQEIKKKESEAEFVEIIEESKEVPEDTPGKDYNTAKIIAQHLELYQDLVEFFELTFPKLLAIKRFLDGEAVDLDVIQSINSSAVRRELTDSDQENSPYFDLIVREYDRDLRNALAHGDIINDSLEREVRTPTKEVQYTYEEIGEILHKNRMNFIFLSGTLTNLVEWRYFTYDLEEFTRDSLPI